MTCTTHVLRCALIGIPFIHLLCIAYTELEKSDSAPLMLQHTPSPCTLTQTDTSTHTHHTHTHTQCHPIHRTSHPLHTHHIQVVPYSDHSSFQELRRFVKALQPKCVRPIVKKFTGDKGTVTRLRANMAIFDDLLDTAGSVSDEHLLISCSL